MYYKRSTGAILVRKSPEIPDWVKWIHHAEGKTHCPECLKLDGCFFTKENHPFCHCTLEAIDYALVLANASVNSIQIEIPRKDTGEIVRFMSGWLVMPNGKLQLATPYRR